MYRCMTLQYCALYSTIASQLNEKGMWNLCRKHGLFPPGDSLLMQLAQEAGTYAFEKHLAGESSPYELLKNGSWTSGDEAAQAGFDLRLFYKALFPLYILPDLHVTASMMVGYSMQPCTA